MEREKNIDGEYKSRTQIKREVKALQKLGERLLELSPEQLSGVDMPEDLREAVLFAKTITSREARRRQLQYIGGLMRKIDPETIREAIAGRDQQSRESAEAFHQLEQWRDELIQGNDALIEELCGHFPQAERQQLRQLARNAKKEREKEKPPKSSRQLFRYLRKLSEEM
jgi:ribosome-associated protein